MLGSLVSVQDNDYIQVIPVYLTYSGCFDTHTEGSCLVLLFQYKIMTISRQIYKYNLDIVIILY
jgi:hypothetical protein